MNIVGEERVCRVNKPGFMKFPILPSTLIALVFCSALPDLTAKPYTSTAFRKALELKIGNRKGKAAYTAAAKFYRTALNDKRNKSKAQLYANSIVRELKPKVSITQQSASANEQIKALLLGYFKGRTFSLNDSVYDRSISVFVKAVPASRRNGRTSQLIYNSIKAAARKSGLPQQDIYNYYLKRISNRFNYPPPPLS